MVSAPVALFRVLLLVETLTQSKGLATLTPGKGLDVGRRAGSSSNASLETQMPGSVGLSLLSTLQVCVTSQSLRRHMTVLLQGVIYLYVSLCLHHRPKIMIGASQQGEWVAGTLNGGQTSICSATPTARLEVRTETGANGGTRVLADWEITDFNKTGALKMEYTTEILIRATNEGKEDDSFEANISLYTFS